MLRFSARAQVFAPVHMYAKGSISSDYLGVPWIIVTRNGPYRTSPRSLATLPASARRERSILNHMSQQQDKHDQHYQAKTTTTVVADSRAHAIAAETEHQQQDK